VVTYVLKNGTIEDIETSVSTVKLSLIHFDPSVRNFDTFAETPETTMGFYLSDKIMYFKIMCFIVYSKAFDVGFDVRVNGSTHFYVLFTSLFFYIYSIDLILF
jgi:hypothetical protein